MVYHKKTVQRSFKSLGEALGMPLSINNHWVQLAEVLPWAAGVPINLPFKVGPCCKAISPSVRCSIN